MWREAAESDVSGEAEDVEEADAGSFAGALVRGRHRPFRLQAEWLGRVVMGYFGYFAIPGNIPALESFRTQVVRYWLRALRRRSQRHRLSWELFGPRVKLLIPHPKILHEHPNLRFYAKHPR